MSTTTPESGSPQTTPWEIYPACDIRLGEFMHENPNITDITIDTDAVAQILHKLDPDSPGAELVFTAAHDDSLEVDPKNERILDENGKRPNNPYHTVGITRTTKASKEINVEVAVAGSTEQRMLEAGQQLAYESLQHSPRSSQAINQITVHELLHATRMAARQNTPPRMYPRLVLGSLAIASAASGFGGYELGDFIEAPIYAKVPIMAAGAVGAFFTSAVLLYEQLHMKPIRQEERAACQAEKLAATLPSAITLS